jgi:OFA family oxalate/formate antiporter-like MFS transporter
LNMSKRGIAVIVAGFLTVFIAYAIRYGYGMLLPEMLPSLQITKTEAGVIYSSYFIAYTILAPALGILADRYDIRKILAIFTCIMGVGTFLMAFSSSITSASLFFAIAGLGHAASWTPLISLIQRWVSDKRRGTALTIMDLGSAMGIVSLSASMPLIVSALDWRAGWICLGIAAILISVVNYILIRNRPPQSKEKNTISSAEPVQPLRVAYGKFLRDSRFWIIGISYLFVGFAVIIPFTFLPTYGVQSLNMPYEKAAGVVAIIAVAGVVGKLILGPLSDTWGRIKVMMVCCALMAAGAMGMILCREFLCLAIISVVFGIGYGAVWPVYAAVTGDYFPKSSIGSVMGLWTLILGIGSISGPVASGWSIDLTGGYSWAFIMAFTASLLALVILIPLLKKRSPAGQ